MLRNFNDYRAYIAYEFEVRNRKNPRYSLRAFARDLGLPPSRLSEVLNGRRRLSRFSVRKIAAALGLIGTDICLFDALVTHAHARNSSVKEAAQREIDRIKAPPNFQSFDPLDFGIGSDWRISALLSVAGLDNAVDDTDWVVQKTGFDPEFVERSMALLKKSGLIVCANGLMTINGGFRISSEDQPRSGIQRIHSDVLSAANLALANLPVEQREFSTTFVTIDRTRMDEAKELIRSFRSEFIALMTKTPPRDAVFCMGIQFFPLEKTPASSTKSETKKK